jgi:predicted dithiol-disulfide oxidoreductase (DUF899 family)
MTATETIHKVVTADEWLEVRRALLEDEKALTRQRDELSRKRRELPWVQVDKNYVFDGREGSVTLSDLFEGRSQLIVYHFMFGPDQAQGCPSCSMVADNIDGTGVHLTARDVTLVMVSRAPIAKIEAFRKRMGWNTRWVSSHRNTFNQDYHVSFTKEDVKRGVADYNFGIGWFPGEEAQGASVFYKDDSGAIFHTYSAYARGVEGLLGTYDLLDMAPKGRGEDGLPFPMAWIRHHDLYAQPPAACCHATERS